jgi:LacI family transcriptional regulator
MRVTMADIARDLGVSKNTVSLALRGDPQISAPTRDRVRAAAHRLGYTLNPVISHLMAELRRAEAPRAHRTIALLNGFRAADAFRVHPTIPAYVAGCRRRAAALGYGTDDFWLHDPQLDGARLSRILEARGIRGLILIGTMDDHRLPQRFAETWPRFACAVTGVRTEGPELSFCCVDHHALVLKAVEQALRLGYRRPGLAIDGKIDRLVEGRFSSGMAVAQQDLPASRRLPAFTELTAAREDPRAFRTWLRRWRPDVILTLYNTVRRWVEDAGLDVPRDIGLIQLEKRPDNSDWAGMDQHNDLVGEAAVEMVVGQIHNGDGGIPAHPRATLIEASWVPGRTVRPH